MKTLWYLLWEYEQAPVFILCTVRCLDSTWLRLLLIGGLLIDEVTVKVSERVPSLPCRFRSRRRQQPTNFQVYRRWRR